MARDGERAGTDTPSEPRNDGPSSTPPDEPAVASSSSGALPVVAPPPIECDTPSPLALRRRVTSSVSASRRATAASSSSPGSSSSDTPAGRSKAPRPLQTRTPSVWWHSQEATASDADAPPRWLATPPRLPPPPCPQETETVGSPCEAPPAAAPALSPPAAAVATPAAPPPPAATPAATTSARCKLASSAASIGCSAPRETVIMLLACLR